MAKKSKKYLEAAKKIDSSKAYSVQEAIALAKETDFAKFDASVEVAYRLGLDPKKADQQLRGAVVLPNGTGKTQRVLVFAKGEKAKEAEAAKSEEEKAKESALDKGIVYRQLPRFGNKPSSSSFRYNEEGGIEEDTSDKSGANPKSGSDTGVTPAGSDEHTTSPSTTERTETGEATHEATPGNPETTGSTTSGKPGKKKNDNQAPDEATSPGRRAEENPDAGLVQPPHQQDDHL